MASVGEQPWYDCGGAHLWFLRLKGCRSES